MKLQFIESILTEFNIDIKGGGEREGCRESKSKSEKNSKGEIVIHTHVWVLASQDGVTSPGHV